MTKRTDFRYWGSTTNQMWNNTKIHGRWTEALLQRDKRELPNIAWQSITECFGIDAVSDNSVGPLLDHRCPCIRYKHRNITDLQNPDEYKTHGMRSLSMQQDSHRGRRMPGNRD